MVTQVCEGQGITGKDSAQIYTIFLTIYENLDYAERLWRLGLWTLEEWRNRADLIKVYKIAACINIFWILNWHQDKRSFTEAK